MSGNWLKYGAVASIVLALVLGLIAYRWTRQLTAPPPPAEHERGTEANAADTLAVIALRPISANTRIGPDDVAVMPVSIAPKDYLSQVSAAIGQVPQLDIDAGAPLTPRYFRRTNLLAQAVPEGHQAVSLEINDVVAVGGFVQPGDIVDLLLYLRGAELAAQSRVLLRGVRVLAYEDRIIDRPPGLEATAATPERRARLRTAVIAVPERQTTRVMLGASLGDIRLALHREAQGKMAAGALPKLTADTASVADSIAEEIPVTLEELARLKNKSAETKKPPPYVIQVYRGSDVQKVTD